MNVVDTCQKSCVYYKKYKENCPHFIQTMWGDTKSVQPKIINDCAPKRAVILQIDAFNRMLGLQKAHEQERNLQHGMLKVMAEVAQIDSVLPLIDAIPDAEILKIEASDEDNGK